MFSVALLWQQQRSFDLVYVMHLVLFTTICLATTMNDVQRRVTVATAAIIHSATTMNDVQRRVTVATAAIIRSGICDASRIVLQRSVATTMNDVQPVALPRQQRR
ncbi:hypothetical protein CEXT_636541 [Caerostris extrusa]|uniref:Secreted peptide n=1 Tax=Caerostris extrusa TaxID=172846 RepID=A0AAV4R631_CAEEX|nr:hypothetical protein CEXT_636541 [Caerostris extrusa]